MNKTALVIAIAINFMAGYWFGKFINKPELLPTTCEVGDLVFKRNSQKVYHCTQSNTWVKENK